MITLTGDDGHDTNNHQIHTTTATPNCEWPLEFSTMHFRFRWLMSSHCSFPRRASTASNRAKRSARTLMAHPFCATTFPRSLQPTSSTKSLSHDDPSPDPKNTGVASAPCIFVPNPPDLFRRGWCRRCWREDRPRV